MLNLIANYVNNITMDDINNFAIKNNIKLSQDELEFTYHFVKNNYEEVLKNSTTFDFDQYKNNYSEENFLKIKQLIKIYANYL